MGHCPEVAMESALRTIDLPFTIIRPNYFFQDDEDLKDPLTKAGVYPMPLGPNGISAVHMRDIAEASAIALTGKGHEGKTYNLNGPEVLSGPLAAQIWTELLGRESAIQAKIWMLSNNRCARERLRGQRSTFG